MTQAKLVHDHIPMTARGRPSQHRLRRHTAVFDEPTFLWLESECGRRRCSMAVLIRTLVAKGRDLERYAGLSP